MPDLVYCKHMDMDVYEGTCAMCAPPTLERLDPNHVLVTMDAQLGSTCDYCGERIPPGQQIALIDGAWVHIEHTEALHVRCGVKRAVARRIDAALDTDKEARDD